MLKNLAQSSNKNNVPTPTICYFLKKKNNGLNFIIEATHGKGSIHPKHTVKT